MLKLVSLNIEIDRHVGRFVPVICAEAPDVVLLQEAPEDIIRDLADRLALPHTAFEPMTKVQRLRGEGSVVIGQAIFSRTPLTNLERRTYGGSGTGRDALDVATAESRWATSRYTILVADVSVKGETYRAATIHFPWSEGGAADMKQREACDRLIEEAAPLGDFVLAGDFNAPRGREIFARLASVFADNIPANYTTSLDGTLHRAGPLPYMVDGLFTTRGYRADQVELRSGVSDHMAIIGRIARNEP